MERISRPCRNSSGISIIWGRTLPVTLKCPFPTGTNGTGNYGCAELDEKDPDAQVIAIRGGGDNQVGRRSGNTHCVHATRLDIYVPSILLGPVRTGRRWIVECARNQLPRMFVNLAPWDHQGVASALAVLPAIDDSWIEGQVSLWFLDPCTHTL